MIESNTSVKSCNRKHFLQTKKSKWYDRTHHNFRPRLVFMMGILYTNDLLVTNTLGNGIAQCV